MAYQAIIILGGLYGLMLTTWLFYLAVMNLSRNQKHLSVYTKLFAYPILWIGLLWDFVFDKVIGTLSFLELRQYWLFTERCSHHLKNPDTGKVATYRRKMATFWCTTFLNPFDPSGNHCNV